MDVAEELRFNWCVVTSFWTLLNFRQQTLIQIEKCTSVL